MPEIEYTRVDVPATVSVAVLKEFAAEIGCKLLRRDDGGLVLMPARLPADHTKKNRT